MDCRNPLPSQHLETALSPTSITITGILEAGARGYLLRDDDGVIWRLYLQFVDETTANGLSGRVRGRGRIVEVDRIEVEYVETQDSA
ncbi:hypothetical protein IM701_19010 (plasmid) [Novosphingobium sp. ES2-1]|jgi:hypothetical protein|nr:hypothetical protein IM701_19010 [Novosphingobium sp. ES2-1]